MKDQQIVHRLGVLSSPAQARRLAALAGGRLPGPWAASRLFAAILLGLAMLAAVPAQQRAPAFGRVVDGAGEPVAGAEVHLLGGVPMLLEEEQELDELRVQTDARGRFRADLLRGSCYSVRAFGPEDQQGERSVSLAGERFGCGGHLELVVDRALRSRTVQVLGMAPWLAQGPLRLRVGLCSRWTRWLELPVGADGTVAVPPLPAGMHAFVVLDGEGQPLCVQRVPSAWPARIEIPPPLAVAVQALDGAEQPVAGAGIHALVGIFVPWRVGGYPFDRDVVLLWRRCAITDALGAAQTVAPASRHLVDDMGLNLASWVAVRPGRAAVQAGDGWAMPVQAPTPLTFTFGDADRSAVRLIGADGEPLRNSRVVVRPGNRFGNAVLRTDGDGGLPLPAGSGASGQWLLQAPDADTWLDLRGPAEVVDLRQTGQVTVQVIGVDAGPAAGLLLARPVHRSTMGETHGVLDPSGRTRLRLWPGTWLVFSVDRRGAAWQFVDVAAGSRTDCRLHLQPMHEVHGRVLSAKEQPVPAAAVSPSMRGSSRLGEAPDAKILEQTIRQYNDSICAYTDADGRYRLRLVQPPSGRGGSLQVFVDGTPRGSTLLSWGTGDLDVRIE